MIRDYTRADAACSESLSRSKMGLSAIRAKYSAVCDQVLLGQKLLENNSIFTSSFSILTKRNDLGYDQNRNL